MMVYLDKIRERGKMQNNTFLLIIIAIELAFIYVTVGQL